MSDKNEKYLTFEDQRIPLSEYADLADLLVKSDDPVEKALGENLLNVEIPKMREMSQEELDEFSQGLNSSYYQKQGK